MMKIGATIEARLGSTRLPGKVLMELTNGVSMLECVYARAMRSKRLSIAAVATSADPRDDAVAQLCRDRGIPVYRGSEDDVMGRVLDAANHFGIELLVRLTGDNPFIDGLVVDDLLEMVESRNLDYATTTHMAHTQRWSAERTFPRGVSMEAVRVDRLAEIAAECGPAERETPTFALYDKPERFRLGAFEAVGKYAAWRRPDFRLTVDTQDDLDLARKLYAALAKDGPGSFSTAEAIEMLANDPILAGMNSHVVQKIMADEVETRRRTQGHRP